MVVQSQPHKEHDIYEWIKIIQANPDDKVTQEKIVKTYEKLVHSLAHRYSKNQSHHEDLFQVVMIILLVAVKSYDASFRGISETIAIPTNIGESKRLVRDKTKSDHVSRRMKDLGHKINATLTGPREKNHRTPQVSEIAQHLN